MARPWEYLLEGALNLAGVVNDIYALVEVHAVEQSRPAAYYVLCTIPLTIVPPDTNVVIVPFPIDAVDPALSVICGGGVAGGDDSILTLRACSLI